MLLCSPLKGLFEAFIELVRVAASCKYGEEEHEGEHAPDVFESNPYRLRSRYDL